jgi:enoyl-CoA hydratase/carnithine racemase
MVRTEPADDGSWRRVTLDRPAARNALRPADLDALATAVADATEPVVLLRGAGPAFCAGADLDTVADHDDPATLAERGQRVAREIETSDAVVIAGVDGPARGGGVELALACDLRVATPDASFAEVGIRLGLFGAWGGTHRLRAEVPPAVARDLMLSGRVIDAEAAHRWGLVSRLVDDPATVAREVADNPADALAAVTGLLRHDGDPAAVERAERERFAALHEQHVDAIRATRESGDDADD